MSGFTSAPPTKFPFGLWTVGWTTRDNLGEADQLAIQHPLGVR